MFYVTFVAFLQSKPLAQMVLATTVRRVSKDFPALTCIPQCFKILVRLATDMSRVSSHSTATRCSGSEGLKGYDVLRKLSLL